MIRNVRIVERARSDVDETLAWLVRRSMRGAVAWYLAFRQALERITSSPESFGEAAECRRIRRPLRQVPFKTRSGRVYRIVFEVTETEIIVLRVRGPGQSPLRRGDLPDQ